MRVEVEGMGDRTCWAVCVLDLRTQEIGWFLSNAPEEIGLKLLVRQHGLRYWIERGFQDGKTSLGMRDYQARGWVAWHPHMAMVTLASLFMLRERRIHLLEAELLSRDDIVELLNVFLPRKDATVVQVLANIGRRFWESARMGDGGRVEMTFLTHHMDRSASSECAGMPHVLTDSLCVSAQLKVI